MGSILEGFLDGQLEQFVLIHSKQHMHEREKVSEQVCVCVRERERGRSVIDDLFLFLGHFPWLFNVMKFVFTHSSMGGATGYIKKVALELIKSRRESGNAEKV